MKWLCEPLASPEAAPYSAAHVSGAMARLSQAPVFVLTAPYASAPRIAMAVGTAAAERGYRFNRRQGGGRHRNAEQHQPERLYKVHGYVSPMKARFRPVALYGSLRLGSSSSRVECSRAATCGRRVRVSAGTNNGHRRILAELSRLSEFRFPETETVSTETRFDWKVTTRPVQGSGADETIRPFDVRLV